MGVSLKYFGNFELIGYLMDNLIKPLGEIVLEKSKEVFSLPKELLEKVDHKGEFHGYQNVLNPTMQKALEGKAPMRNQGGVYHLRPYKEPRVPEGVDVNIYYEFYNAGMPVLYCLERFVAIYFNMNPENVSRYENDASSVLTNRQYLPGGYYEQVHLVSSLPEELIPRVLYLCKQDSTIEVHASHLREPVLDKERVLDINKYEQLISLNNDYLSAFLTDNTLNDFPIEEDIALIEKIANICGYNVPTVGIPWHTDYGSFTMLGSYQGGLVVKIKGTEICIPVQQDSNNLRIFVNICDWLIYQLDNKNFESVDL